MLQFINSIRVKRNEDETDDQEFSELTDFERTEIQELFFKSKPTFTFKDIKAKLCGKKHEDWEFNYIDDTNIAGCPVSTSIIDHYLDLIEQFIVDHSTGIQFP
jgi:hypothetical protein